MKRITTSLFILLFLLICLYSCGYNFKESLNRKFIKSDEAAWEDMADGVKRQILGYDKRIMLVRVDFRENSTGVTHKHVHSQSSYVLNGEFDVSIDGITRTLKEGDSFFVPSGQTHGVLCTKAGSLIEAFSPARKDFLTPKK